MSAVGTTAVGDGVIEGRFVAVGVAVRVDEGLAVGVGVGVEVKVGDAVCVPRIAREGFVTAGAAATASAAAGAESGVAGW
ncbi:MAG: hypothetical protein ACWGO1_05935, partial [Anaerolineales bacterium]